MKIPGYFKRSSFVAFAATALALAGCTRVEEDIFRDGTRPSDRLAFSAAIERRNAGVTRSSVACLEIAEEDWEVQTMSDGRNVTRAQIANHLIGEAGVIGFQYDDSEGSNRIPIADGDNNTSFTFNGDQLTSTSTTILWQTITKTNLDIYAYAPKEADGLAVTSTTTPPVLEYTVPSGIAGQTDILVSRWKSREQPNSLNYKNQTLHLAFDHALTAICFKTGFKCTVKSVEINNVYNKGSYNLENGAWEVDHTSTTSYEFIPEESPDGGGVPLEPGNDLIARDDCFILMPQTLPAGAKIVLTVDEAGTERQYTALIEGKVWEPGKLITYTLYKKDEAPETIYFDLAAQNVIIDGENYSGAVFKKDARDPNKFDFIEVTGTHKDGNRYYVYQSSFPSGTGDDPLALADFDNRGSIWSDDGKVCTPPVYKEVKGPDGRPWSEFITNNTDVDKVIEAWDVKNNDLVTNVKRRGTKNWIKITGAVTCELTIDNIYSVYQDGTTQRRITAGITFVPIRDDKNVRDAKVTIKMIGDNRVGAVHYSNYPEGNGNQIIFEGTGSLTVADVDGYKGGDSNTGLEVGQKGYWSNHFCSAIGGNDWPSSGEEEAYGIVINSGTIFAGTTKAENCTAIGGGGNKDGQVIINGGTVTAVATTTGTAIGGGIGFSDPGGPGFVTITGGNVYAYNHANKWSIPSSAIGGAGSRSSAGASGKVTIEGGYVYAYSAGGTAIGGGSSYTLQGGGADITIRGGEVFAKTGSEASSSIGGGTACSGTSSNNYDGGNATITIFGNPIIRTGSIGGGGKGVGKGYIGSAHIQISGNADIQAQFILSAGTKESNVPTFHMVGGMIRNSDTADEEYLHVKKNGGAVYLENGEVTIEGGTIQNCSAEHGGAIYIEGSQGSDSNAKFVMTGGTIQGNESSSDGGAIYIIDGTADLSGGNICDNLAAGGNGGGIFIQRGSLEVNGATIQNNSSEIRRNGSSYIGGNGGGIYVFSLLQNVNVDLLSGIITDNTADRKGGGVCVDMQNSSNSANVTIGTEGGSDDGIRIMYNHSLQQGGGLYARGSKADITINSGTIMDNTVSQYVYNQNVANERGSVTLNGGNVTHNVVKFFANYGDDSAPAATQNIVTSTNSTLVAPALTRQGYRLEGWNTKPSGKGESYHNGQVMNINEDITLYAQWAIDV